MRRLVGDRALALSVVLFCVLVAVSLVVAAVALNRTNELTRQTNASLCALRHDLEERVRGGEAFLLDHPHGIPGIPARTLRVSLSGQRRTIRALGNLSC